MKPSLTRSSKRAWLGGALSMLAVLIMVGGAPASAHEEHRRQRAAALKAQQMRAAQAALRPGSGAPAASRPAVPPPIDVATAMPRVDRSKMSFSARLLDWVGRWHSIIVHFPIAFFPAALFTAIVGRKRPAFAKPVQFLVVAGGITAPIAAALGWIDGGFTVAADDWLLSFHRWFGTGVAVGALALAVWAVRKPELDRGGGMIAGLAILTAALAVQGWFGGAMTHGLDHLNW